MLLKSSDYAALRKRVCVWRELTGLATGAVVYNYPKSFLSERLAGTATN